MKRFLANISHGFWEKTGGIKRLKEKKGDKPLHEIACIDENPILSVEKRIESVVPEPCLENKNRANLVAGRKMFFPKGGNVLEKTEAIFVLILLKLVEPTYRNDLRFCCGSCGELYSISEKLFHCSCPVCCDGSTNVLCLSKWQMEIEQNALSEMISLKNINGFVQVYCDIRNNSKKYNYSVYGYPNGISSCGYLRVFIGADDLVERFAKENEKKLQPISIRLG